MAFCPKCGTQVADLASCPNCATAPAIPRAAGADGGISDNLAGALAYLTIIPAIVFLVLEPFNKKRFVRFHSFQCIFFSIAWTVLWFAMSFVSHLPFLGWAVWLLSPLLGLVGLILWILLVLKAYQGQTFKLPILGDLAESQASTG
jgi:uncharacterized membrane protein